MDESLSDLAPPSYVRVYADIFIGYGLIACGIAFITSDTYAAQAMPIKAVLLLAIGLLNGLLFHYLTLFTHAAGHWELAHDKKRNDVIGNWLVGYIFLTNIDMYRKKHFGHHRHVGTDQDPEGSYSVKPNLTNFLSVSLLLIPLQKLMGIWKKSVQKTTNKMGSKLVIVWVITVFLSIQAAMLYFFASRHLYIEWLAVWVIPIFSLMPLFNWLRTLCEHRPFDNPDNHAAIYRAFKPDLLGFFLGPAGFCDHDLHHAYPYLHYTQFAEFQEKRPDKFARRARDTYGAVLLKLFSI